MPLASFQSAGASRGQIFLRSFSLVALLLVSALGLRADTTASAPIGSTVTFSVATAGDGPFYYTWLKNGTQLPGKTSPTLVISNAQLSDTGSYSVWVTNATGSVLSDVGLVGVGVIPPSFVSQPVGQSVGPGSNVSLSVNVTGTPAPVLQWYLNGVAIPGATSAVLNLTNVNASNSGNYTVVASNFAGPVTSTPAFLNVMASRLVNVSVRTFPGTGSQTLIAGFVTLGGDKSIMIRGIGPGLSQYTASPVFIDPVLDVYQSTSATPIFSNDNWGGSTTLKNLFTQLGAFSISDTSKDAVVSTIVQPGVYSAVVTGPGTGLALAEIYDADPNGGGRIVNLSARTQVNTGDGVLIAGFVIGGSGPKQLLIRGIGPTLTTYGVGGALADPKLDLYLAGGTTPIQTNDNWGGGAAFAAAFAATGAFALPDANSKDAALLVTLDPGSYSVILSGVNNTTGVGLVEIYEVP